MRALLHQQIPLFATHFLEYVDIIPRFQKKATSKRHFSKKDWETHLPVNIQSQRMPKVPD
jgi:hypothetical protein